MRKVLGLFIAVFLIFGLLVTPSHAAFKDMWAHVYSWDGQTTVDGKYKLTRITSGVTYVVMMANSVATLETLYYYDNDAFTSLGNPVTGTNFASDSISGDKVAFRTDPTESNDTAVDLIVVDQAGGYTAFIENFDEYTHTIVIDERPGVKHHGVAFIVTTGSSSETDTGIDFDTNTIIHDMLIQVGTSIAGGTTPLLNVGILSSGTNGDADGFIYLEDVATAGFHSPFKVGPGISSYSYSSGGEVPTINPSTVGNPSAGTYLGHFAAGTSDTGTIIGGTGIVGITLREELVLEGTWETSLTYTFPTSHASTGWGLIHFWFTRIH